MTIVELAGGSPDFHLEKLVNDEFQLRQIECQFGSVPGTDLAKCEIVLARHKNGQKYVARVACTDQNLAVSLIQMMEFQDYESVIGWPEERRAEYAPKQCCARCGDIMLDGFLCVCQSFPNNPLSLEIRLDGIARKMNDENALRSLLRACRITYAYACISHHNGTSGTGAVRKTFDAIDANNRQTWHAYAKTISDYLPFHCTIALEEIIQFASEAKIFA